MAGSSDQEQLPNGQDVAAAIAEGVRAHELDRAHVFHSWSAQAALKPMTVLASQGSYVWDGDGNKLLDFSSQMVNTNIGHQHPKVVAAGHISRAGHCALAEPKMGNTRVLAPRVDARAYHSIRSMPSKSTVLPSESVIVPAASSVRTR